MFALGRALIIESDWVQKVADGKEPDIFTEIQKDHQKHLVIQNPLWHIILTTPGWFPGVKIKSSYHLNVSLIR